ncbi:hypothetical protein ACFO5X_23405 [Seohaeicola nanhaiensis]|uniref:Uncharacterized protein n=1 Tax=Seohaeicola nanhaiensis TaxID=1387282 RepID=A0ABV9KMY2_9RHOB
MGLNLSLGSTTMRASATPENTIKAALKERHHISAIRDGVKVLIQPYALLKIEGTTLMHGVVVHVDGAAQGDWTPGNIPLPALSDIKVYDQTFVPSDAFDASALDGVIAVVQGFDPFQDAGEGAAS